MDRLADLGEATEHRHHEASDGLIGALGQFDTRLVSEVLQVD